MRSGQRHEVANRQHPGARRRTGGGRGARHGTRRRGRRRRTEFRGRPRDRADFGTRLPPGPISRRPGPHVGLPGGQKHGRTRPLLPLNRDQTHPFFQIVPARKERGSTVMASNPQLLDLGSGFRRLACRAAAILDRIHNAQVVQIQTGSHRLKDTCRAGIIGLEQKSKEARPRSDT